MRKSEDLDRIAASAIERFSQLGYEGTSLRDIANHAGVTLSRIDRYFGSKLDLFSEVQRRVWMKISAEREEMLQNPISKNAKGEPTLEALLYAFVYPIAKRSAPAGNELPIIRLLREAQSARVHMGLRCGPDAVTRGVELWISRVTRACPSLERDRVVWMLSFVVSITFSVHLTHGWFDDFLTSARRWDPSEVARLVVQFCRAGIEAVENDTGQFWGDGMKIPMPVMVPMSRMSLAAS